MSGCRACPPRSASGQPSTYRNNLSLVKGAMAMLAYFYAFGPQIARLRAECGTASAIAGIFKAPFDIIADKLRGYRRPDDGHEDAARKSPHGLRGPHAAPLPRRPDHRRSGQAGAHRFLDAPRLRAVHQPQDHSTRIYWPTLKPIIEEFWKHGHQTLFYAEGKWHHHFDAFRELPDRSIVFHCDRDDIFEAHRKLHDKFALSGGIPERAAQLRQAGRGPRLLPRASSTRSPRTAATSWTPAPSCRTTPASRTSAS